MPGRPRLEKDPAARRRHPNSKPGPPPAKMDWVVVGGMAEIHCTLNEILSVTGHSWDTLNKAAWRDHRCSIAEFIESKKDLGRRSLRRVQMDTALAGNVVMQIWLGKQLLGQTDKVETIDKEWARGKKKAELVDLGRQALEVLQRESERGDDGQGRAGGDVEASG